MGITPRAQAAHDRNTAPRLRVPAHTTPCNHSTSWSPSARLGQPVHKLPVNGRKLADRLPVDTNTPESQVDLHDTPRCSKAWWQQTQGMDPTLFGTHRDSLRHGGPQRTLPLQSPPTSLPLRHSGPAST